MLGKLKYILIIFVLMSMSSTVFAEDRYIDINIDKNEIPLSGSVKMDLLFHNIEDMLPPKLPAIEGFKTTHLRSSPPLP